jgi:hypothetical protein
MFLGTAFIPILKSERIAEIESSLSATFNMVILKEKINCYSNKSKFE